MNPAKRKKLARLAAAKATQTPTVTEAVPVLKVEEKVVEETLPTVEVVAETVVETAPAVEEVPVEAPVVAEVPAPVTNKKKKNV